MTPPPFVHIHYLRPPNRTEIFTQRLLLDAPEVKVTLAQSVPFDPPIRIQDKVALEKGSDAVWFTYPDLWHDIGRFHRADGFFTGFYANILTPPVIQPNGIWHTTDLFLDIWVDAEGRLTVLDEDQFQEALDDGVVSTQEGERAMREVEWIRKRHREGAWPGPEVMQWTLERARHALKAP